MVLWRVSLESFLCRQYNHGEGNIIMENDNFSKYCELREKGLSPAGVYRQARADGVGDISCFRILRIVSGLSIVDAKSVITVTSGQSTALEEHEEKLLPGLERALQDFEDEG